MNKAQIQERIEKCHQILGANPNSQIFAALAEAHRKLGDLKMALEVCDRGLKTHPSYGSAHLVLAKVARDQRRFEDAERAAFRAIELDGRTRSAEILLSDIYLQIGEFGKAEELLDDLEQADPSNESVCKLRALVVKARQLAEMSGSGNVLVHGSATGALLVPRDRGLIRHARMTRSAKPSLVAKERGPAESATPFSGAASSASSAVSREAEMSWEQIFAGLGRYPKLKGKVAAGYDGLLLESDPEVESDAETVAATAAELFSAIRSEWLGDRFGTMKHLFIETEVSSWFIWPFDDFLLLLWCDPGINMGPLRMRLSTLRGSRADQSLGGGA